MSRLRLYVFALFWLAGCVPEGSGGSDPDCEPGEVAACLCPDGMAATRVCGDDGRFPACGCESDGAVESDGVVEPDSARPDGASADAMPADAGSNDTGPDAVIDVDGTIEIDATTDVDGARPDAAEPDGAAPDAEPADADLPDGADPDGGCVPRCGERACGDDGCGGVCGRCDAGEACEAGRCEPVDGCGDGICGDREDCATCAADCACADGENCIGGQCEPGVGGAPRFLTFNSNVRRLTEGEEVTFSAVVTDPDGIDDLIGGVLEDPNGQSYGAFVSSGQEGAYSMTVSWDDIHRIAAIEFHESRQRTFVAVFFDQGGLSSRQEIIVELHCEGIAACDGACVDLSDDEAHCGACAAACAEDATCDDGGCACDPGFFSCGNDQCVPEATVCDRADDCGDGSDEADCCFADADCPLGTSCGEDNRCAPGCTGDWRCPADEQCRDGACVPGCVRDDDCFAAEYCRPDGRCDIGCRGDESCRAGEICELRLCRRGCRDDDACGAGQICEDLQCRAGCRADGECGADRICEDTACRVGCREDAACGEGEICQATRCVEGCRGDDGCDLDAICAENACVPGCQVDAVCDAGTICRDGQCRAGCNVQQPCPDPELCFEGACRPPCEVDRECGFGSYCDAVCRPHRCDDGRLGPEEECDDPSVPGCSDACLLEEDTPRLEDEPYRIVFEEAGRHEVLFRLHPSNDEDRILITAPAGVMRLEIAPWNGGPCEEPLDLLLRPEVGNARGDDSFFSDDCPLLALEEGDRMTLVAGTSEVELGSRFGVETSVYRLIVEFTPYDIGSDCDPDGLPVCPFVAYCAAETGVCTAHRCGDGILWESQAERCDDGNDIDGDGCEDCRIVDVPLGGPCEVDGPYDCEDGTVCSPFDQVCVEPVCGDGFVSFGERCDDANDVAGDGCDACQLDPSNEIVEPDRLVAPYDLEFEDDRAEVIFEIDGFEREDYFRFEVDVPRPVRLTLRAYPDDACFDRVWVRLYDAGLERIAVNYVDRDRPCIGLDTTDDPELVLAPGTYTLEVETNRGAIAPTWLILERLAPTQCSDGIDNDGDGRVDAADPGCLDFFDDDEADPVAPTGCSDGVDNDEDGLIDHPLDPDCAFAGTAVEGCVLFDDIPVIGPAGGRIEVVTEGRPNLVGASCGNNAGGGELPVMVVLDEPATIRAEIVLADYDTVLHARLGCGEDGVEIVCDDDGGQDRNSLIEIERPAGGHYIFVDGYGNLTGTATLEVTVTP